MQATSTTTIDPGPVRLLRAIAELDETILAGVRAERDEAAAAPMTPANRERYETMQAVVSVREETAAKSRAKLIAAKRGVDR